MLSSKLAQVLRSANGLLVAALMMAACGGDVGSQAGVRTVTASALGGVRVELPPNLVMLTDGDNIVVGDRDTNYGQNGVFVGRVSQTADGAPITTIEDFLTQVTIVGEVDFEVGTETVELFGEELTLHRFRAKPDLSFIPLFQSAPLGFVAGSVFSMYPLADGYLAELDDAVLTIASFGESESQLAAAQDIFDVILPTLSLATPGGKLGPLPDVAEFPAPGGGGEEFVPASVIANGPPALSEAFGPIEAGEYQVLNTASPLVLTVPEGWLILPNFPALVVFADEEATGPADKDVVIQYGANQLVPASLGPVVAGEPFPLDNIEDLLTDPPKNLELTNIERKASLGGLEAVRFDLRISGQASCQEDDPCSYFMTNLFSEPIEFKPGHFHRVWWVDSVPEFGPLTVIVGTLEESWLPEAEALIDTFEFAS